MSRHAKLTQPELFDTVDCSPLFSGLPVPVITPEPRPTITPDAPPVSTWDWAGTLTPTEATPDAPATPEPAGEYVYQVWSDKTARYVTRPTERRAYAIQTADFLACDGTPYRVAQFWATMPTVPEVFIHTATPVEIGL